MRTCRVVFLLIGFLAFGSSIEANVPVRISIKFILDANNNRPAFGSLNTDAEIETELAEGIAILVDNLSELTIDRLELIDLPGVSQFSAVDATPANRDALRDAAVGDPALYRWRSDAINVYITGGTGSAISAFPDDNDIILMNQSCGNTPSCLLHELGHSLNLKHTHDDDDCDDTIDDNESWTRDQLALNSFGMTYSSCSLAQQQQVDLVFNNIMSYHTSEPQRRVSLCQMNRMSSQADDDRGWLLSRTAIYVDGTYDGWIQNGRFVTPYATLGGAVAAGGLNGKALVLQVGNYNLPVPLDASVFMLTRAGVSRIDRAALLWSLPTQASSSTPAAARDAILRAQAIDTDARSAARHVAERLGRATSAMERAEIVAEGMRQEKALAGELREQLRTALALTVGEERVAVAFELAQRCRDAGHCLEAVGYFQIVETESTQGALRERALRDRRLCQAHLEK